MHSSKDVNNVFKKVETTIEEVPEETKLEDKTQLDLGQVMTFGE